MKINSINLNAYQAMNNIKPAAANNQKPVQQAQSPARIKGANFNNQLSEQEINFLNNNFTSAETVASANSRNLITDTKHKIDVLA